MFGMNKWYNGLIALIILVLLFKALGSSWWILFALFGMIPCMGGWYHYQQQDERKSHYDDYNDGYNKAKRNDTYDGDTLIL